MVTDGVTDSATKSSKTRSTDSRSREPAEQFELNGDSFPLEAPLTVRGLLERFDLGRRRVAVAINGVIVPRSRFSEIQIQPGDRVEVIQAVGGGA